MNKSHWGELQQGWERLKPPLRPNQEVTAAVSQAVAAQRDRILLLGVTPELADIGSETIAVDRSADMIAHIWPGNTARRRAIKANWLALPLPAHSISATIGDGSLNILRYPHGYRTLFQQLVKILQPGGRIVIRLYQTPDRGEPLAQVRRRVLGREIGSFHAFKWHFAMAIVAARGDPNLEVARIHEVFVHEFPDRATLARATGWPHADIDMIDLYRGSSEIYSFPTAAQLAAVVPDFFTAPQFLASGTYELAERCPLVVLDLRE